MATKVCDTDLPLTGNPSCDKINDFGSTTTLFFTADDFEFATKSSFATKADWLTGIAEGKIIPVPDVYEFDDQSEETKYYDSALGLRLKLRQGKYRTLYRLQKSFEVHKQLQGLSNRSMRLFQGDVNGNIKAYSPDGTKVKGFSLGLVNAEKMMPATADAPAWTPLFVQEEDPNELNVSGVVFNPTTGTAPWFPSDLDGIVPVVIESETVQTNDLTVSVYADGGIDGDGAAIKIPISGLDIGSFSVVDSGGADIDVVTEPIDGTYVLVGDGASWATGTVQILPLSISLFKSNIEDYS